MARWKQWNSVWTIVLVMAIFSPLVLTRPSDDTGQDSTIIEKIPIGNIMKHSEISSRSTTTRPKKESSVSPIALMHTSAPRDVKNATPVIGESIKVVASQLLHSTKSSVDHGHVEDTRTPPKMKTHMAKKNKTMSKSENSEEKIENSHAGIAMPVTMEELEKDSHLNDVPKETSTSQEGISTWILLSNPSSTMKPSKNISKTGLLTNNEDSPKKPKPSNPKHKTKKPQPTGTKIPAMKRPIIASTNKSDLVAGGSAMNENVFNKIKATVLANVQKNKHAAANRTTTPAPITLPVTETVSQVTKKDSTTKAPTTVVAIDSSTVTEKVAKPKKKKKNKNKNRTPSTINIASAMLPMEPKEQEIELEVSTPPTTTKKPKRSSTKRKKNKTKKRKPSTSSNAVDSETSQTKIGNNTKVVKPATKIDNPISSQIYNYLSREVMPTVGVGIVGLAGLVGLASYFLYPFAGPVRRVLDVDKKDDLYRHNAEEYANDGNGQAEEEMLGTVLAGMPTKSNRINPYVNQSPVRQQALKESDQNIRYRHVSTNSDINNFNTHYSQQKTGIAHAAVYSDPISYNPSYETKHVYPIENKQTVYPSESQNGFNAYSPVEPIYTAPQSGPSGPSSYGSETSNTVVYGIKPTQVSNFEPVYPFEGQVFSETTSFPMTYPPTSMYLGSNNESENPGDVSYNVEMKHSNSKEPQFVVGNVPKEFIHPVTPAVVPEHGPRHFERKKRGLADSLEEILRNAKDENKDLIISNEIDEALGKKADDHIPMATKQIEVNNDLNTVPTFKFTDIESKINYSKTSESENIQDNKTTPLYPVYTVYPVDINIPITNKDYTSTANPLSNTASTIVSQLKDEIIENISTLPFDSETIKSQTSSTTEQYENDLTTKMFRVYEVFPTISKDITQSITDKISNFGINDQNEQTTENTVKKENIDDSSTLDYPKTGVLELTSTTDVPIDTNTTETTSGSKTEKPLKYSTTNIPPQSTSTLAYPQDGSIFSLIKRLFEFKFRLGMSILQTTSDSLTRYLRSMESTVQRVAKASGSQNNYK